MYYNKKWAVNAIKQMSEDEKLKEIERIRDKSLHDEASALKTAKAEGIELGRTEGIEKVALNMLNQGNMTLHQIATLTGLSLPRIEEIQQSL